MNTMKSYRAAARLALGAAIARNLLALPLTSLAATYSFTDLNPGGSTWSQGFGISGTQQVGDAYARPGGFYPHALFWSGTASNAVDLTPGGFTWAVALATSGAQQVGHGNGPGNGIATGNFDHALLWSGTAESVVDLHPSSFWNSKACAISGGQQVGYGYRYGGPLCALLWSGTADSVVNLNPFGVGGDSFAVGVSGNQQVGYGYAEPTGYKYHALLWSGTASSVVDLNPIGFTSSIGCGISGGQQVGVGDGHALLWSGTAASVVDLNPSGVTSSFAIGNFGSQQVGVGDGHALLWSGTANSVVDLHSFLSSDYSGSEADAIDTNGNIVGWATYIPTGQAHAILWTRLPESFVICNDPGQCGAVATYSTGANVTCSPPSGSFCPAGVTTVTCTATNPAITYAFTVTVKDCEPPAVSCQPVRKSFSRESPKLGRNSEREGHLNGFYELLGHDNCDPNPRLYIQDSASGFLAGPFANGDIVQLTKKHGRQDSNDAKDSRDSKNARPPIVPNIRLQGNGLLYGIDASGNVGASVLCKAPHGRED